MRPTRDLATVHGHVGSYYNATAIAYILTIVGRSAIGGSVAAFMSQASTLGAGGLVLDVGCIIATGYEAPKFSPTTNEEESRKRLLPIAIASPAAVVIDNVEGMFGSPSLAAAITSGSIEDRVLGESTNKRVPFRTVIGVTGNNVQLYNDLGRRIIPIEIMNDMEHREDRAGFRYPDLKVHVLEHRAQLVASALTLLRAYIVAGMPKHGFGGRMQYGLRVSAKPVTPSCRGRHRPRQSAVRPAGARQTHPHTLDRSSPGRHFPGMRDQRSL